MQLCVHALSHTHPKPLISPVPATGLGFCGQLLQRPKSVLAHAQCVKTACGATAATVATVARAFSCFVPLVHANGTDKETRHTHFTRARARQQHTDHAPLFTDLWRPKEAVGISRNVLDPAGCARQEHTDHAPLPTDLWRPKEAVGISRNVSDPVGCARQQHTDHAPLPTDLWRPKEAVGISRNVSDPFGCARRGSLLLLSLALFGTNVGTDLEGPQ
eukprot:366111-Chlamydomonas_euryale.AAC.7